MTPVHRNLAALLAVASFSSTACGAAAETKAPSAPVTLASEDHKTLYAMGAFFSQNVARLNLTAEEMAAVEAGFADGVHQRPLQIKMEDYGPKMQAFAQARIAAAAAVEQQAGASFLESEAKKPGVTRTAAGFLYSEITPGTGATPAATDQVTVHYHGTLRDGRVFDSSVERGQPATFQLGGVIPCWTQGLQMMKVGGKSRLVCPAALAYGDRSPSDKIPAGATLAFEVELLSIGAAAAPRQ
jgi:FKBP-type peptidyl-prolyl cis-trans isomerase FkpA